MTDAVAVQAPAASVDTVTQGAGFYTSLRLNTRAEKMQMLKAINNSTPLQDKVGEEVAIVDVVLQEVQIPNEATGVVEDAIRATLIDADGNAFHATSKGIVQSLKQTFNVIGAPDTWDEPLVVGVAEERSRNGGFRYLTLKF